jgi:hypothetical protein
MPTSTLPLTGTKLPTWTETAASPLPATAPLPIAATSLPVAAPPAISALLEDDFSDALNINWKAWGEPRPTIRTGFGDSWLDLKAADKPGQSGVTARIELANSPGSTVEFEAQLNSGYPQFPILFDWDPFQFIRGPENTEPTIVHFELRRNLAVLQAPAANNTCQTPLDGLKKHIYRIRFADEKLVELYVDSSEQPLCQIDMGVKPVPGNVSFSGTGWITRILVTSTSTP